MALRVRRSEDDRFTFVQATGPVTFSEWESLRDEEEAIGGRRFLLADVREREGLPTGTDAREWGYLAPAWLAAAIVTRHGAQYGMARVTAAIAERRGVHVCVFTEPTPAREWLASYANAHEQDGSSPGQATRKGKETEKLGS